MPPGRLKLSPASGTVGQFRLLASLGDGGMAHVYLAVRKGPIALAKLQVVKSMRPELAEDPEFVAMFVDEARLAVRLNHPNVVHTTEVDEFEGRLYLAMEYLDGQPLNVVSARATRQRGLSLPLTLRIVSDVLAGLHHAHELRDYDGSPLRIVHRDVTPGNIFVTYEGQAKLVDFGIAKAAVRAAETRVGMVKGKTGYMAPEQMYGRDVDRRADVFSVGVVLWELAVGRQLWEAAEPAVLLVSGAPPLRSVRRDLPAELERICAKALSLDPAHRYATAADMQEDVERFAASAQLRCSSRDLAEFITRAFPGERGAMRALIERRIAELRAEGELTVTRTVTRTTGHNTEKGEPASPVTAVLDSVPPEPTSVSTRPAAVVPNVPRRRALALASAGGGAAIGVLAAIWYGPVLQIDGPPVSASQSVSTPAPTVREPEPPPHIELRIVATPADAQVVLDGAELDGNPFWGKFARDVRLHRVEVRAEGYEPMVQFVEFASDVQLVVTLEKLDSTERPPRAATAAPPDGSARPSAAAPSARARAIDTADPWR